jgi:hypothetical protein
MAAGSSLAGVDWEALGAEPSAALDAAHAILVTGTDAIAAARAALGIGRTQSRTRRVAIGDLVGEVEPLQALITGDDPHGIVDSFLYGVSLNKIARPVDDSGMLFIMPSGTEPTVSADIMRNERWRRLSAGFREVGALLILVAPSDAEGVHELASMLDGVVVVGDAASVLAVPRNSVLAFVDAPQAAPTPAAVPVIPVQRIERPVTRPTPVMLPTHASTMTPPHGQVVVQDRSRLPRLAMIGGGILAAAGIGWYALGMPGVGSTSDPSSSAPVSAPSTPATPGDSVTPSGSADSSSAAARRADSLTAMLVANPGDSLNAASYGVVVVATNDEAQALARWADLGLKLPAGTVSMVRVRGERGRFFQMQAGAFTRAKQADSLLAALRTSGKLGADAGRVVATPYALVLERKVSRRAAQTVANGYGQRQIAAYALLQADGTATIFVGAFEAPEQALPLMNELKTKGVGTALFYRTGRSF